MSRAGTHRAYTILAVSDVHSPRFLPEFLAALSKHVDECRNADLVIFAGDMVERGRVEALRPVLDGLRARCGPKRVVAVFGNEEYVGTEEKYVKLYPDVVWLNDGHYEVSSDLAVYGTRGSLDRLTRWQRRNMPWLEKVYADRVRMLEEEVSKLKQRFQNVVVVMHYAPTFQTVVGEPRAIWPELGSRAMEAAIRRVKPTLVLHGHAHRARIVEASLDGVKVLNVAFPARRDVTLVRLPAG